MLAGDDVTDKQIAWLAIYLSENKMFGYKNLSPPPAHSFYQFLSLNWL